ncbi:MAG: Phosphohistidine phosphatase SixA [Nitrospira sp.]|nr:MAG: Phosphohistidine phosphatase SixA [Nitrospira sp.]
MDCVLMRHGIAVEAAEWSGLDNTRPLTDQGRKKVRQVAQGLATMGLTPTHLFTSPLIRARETAEIVNRILCPSIAMALCDVLKPDSKPQLLTAFLLALPSDSVVLCVGHEPLLGATSGYLLTRQTSRNYPMKKAGAGLIHLPDSAQAGEGLLRWWCPPAQLRALGEAMKDKDYD